MRVGLALENKNAALNSAAGSQRGCRDRSHCRSQPCLSSRVPSRVTGRRTAVAPTFDSALDRLFDDRSTASSAAAPPKPTRAHARAGRGRVRHRLHRHPRRARHRQGPAEGLHRQARRLSPSRAAARQRRRKRLTRQRRRARALSRALGRRLRAHLRAAGRGRPGASQAKFENGVLTLTLAKKVPDRRHAAEHRLIARCHEPRPAQPARTTMRRVDVASGQRGRTSNA